MDREGLTVFDTVVLAVGGATVLFVAVVWAGAALALVVSGEPVELSVGDAAGAMPRLGDHAADPASAWPRPDSGRLPGPIVYWACTAVAAVVAVAVVALAVRFLAGPRVGTARRRPLGVDARPAWGSWRELRPLLVRRPVPGRSIVARLGSWFVATEVSGMHPSRRRGRGRRGDRGAVALVGPTRSGKTVAAISGILEWDGPAVLSSVKADLLGSTVGWRSHNGSGGRVPTRAGLVARQVSPAAGGAAVCRPAGAG